jgi:predicted LPLAT superfamily acyltransferase
MTLPGRPKGEFRSAQHQGTAVTTPAPHTAADWTAERERSNLWALRLMRWIAVAAGRPLARGVLHPIALYFLLVHGKARRASLNYLVRVLGRPVGWRDAYRHIHHFAATILDRVYFLQERVDQFEVTASGAAALHEPLDRGEGVMLVGAHLGSFEALRASAQGRGARVAMLMYEDNARLLNATLAAVAPNVELHTIALGRAGAMLTLRRWLDDGGIAGLLADRTLPGQSDRARTLTIDFLGQPARFSDGPFRLAAMLRRQVVFMAGLYHGGNRYELRFVELADFRVPRAPGGATGGPSGDTRIAEAMQRYVALLESLCRESPYNWFNFFDFWATDAAADTALH